MNLLSHEAYRAFSPLFFVEVRTEIIGVGSS